MWFSSNQTSTPRSRSASTTLVTRVWFALPGLQSAEVDAPIAVRIGVESGLLKRSALNTYDSAQTWARIVASSTCHPTNPRSSELRCAHRIRRFLAVSSGLCAGLFSESCGV